MGKARTAPAVNYAIVHSADFQNTDVLFLLSACGGEEKKTFLVVTQSLLNQFLGGFLKATCDGLSDFLGWIKAAQHLGQNLFRRFIHSLATTCLIEKSISFTTFYTFCPILDAINQEIFTMSIPLLCALFCSLCTRRFQGRCSSILSPPVVRVR